MRYFIKLCYLPFHLIVGYSLAIFIIEIGASTVWLFALLLVFIVLVFLLERYIPFDPRFNVPQQDQKRDFLHALVNESMNVIGIFSIPYIAYVVALFITVPSLWPADWPIVLQLILAIFIADLGISYTHYLSHKYKLLWKLHAVHHSIKRLYGFNGLMKHPVHQLIETLAGTLPLLLLGIPQDILMLFATAVVLQLLLQHSNIDYFTGPLKYVLSLNVLHRFHHLNTAKEGDVNFGLFTTFVDYLLGTFYYDKNRTITVDNLGLSSDTSSGTNAGISSENSYPIQYLAQLKEPFKS